MPDQPENRCEPKLLTDRRNREVARRMRDSHWGVMAKVNEDRTAHPVSLTDTGRKAFSEKHRYDMEPVCGGMASPDWACVQAESSPDTDTLAQPS